MKPYTFRASADERRWFDAQAEALGLRPNELARRRAFAGYAEQNMSTETGPGGKMSTDSRPPRRELTVEPVDG